MSFINNICHLWILIPLGLVMNYKKQQKAAQRPLLREMMQDDEETGLYDT